MPANKKFIFQVGVYDEDLNSWSEISDEYDMFQMKHVNGPLQNWNAKTPKTLKSKYQI